MAAVKAEFQIYFIYESTLIQCEQITATAYHIKELQSFPRHSGPWVALISVSVARSCKSTDMGGLVSEMSYNVSMGTLNPTIPYLPDTPEFPG